ncbi:MAG: hypothetical protein P4L54_11075 [Acidocella sp.]|nr:hypothetical protein [Acidocella sp.]
MLASLAEVYHDTKSELLNLVESMRIFNTADGAMIFSFKVIYQGDFLRLEMNSKP